MATGVGPVTDPYLEDLDMARVLETFDFPTNGFGKQTHPWPEWSDGKIRELKRGEDFAAKPITIATQARAYAKKNKLVVRVKLDNDQGTCVLQFVTPQPANGQENAVHAKPRTTKRK